ncbi:MAG: hypothetical protein FJ148_22385 [Deltaproteobacteria bacterium]|nr:hypothetical protein [Deltaproteobacteria bacterium]
MTLAAPELARRIADALEAERIPYAIGGAPALAAWGFPRATSDVDLDFFVPSIPFHRSVEARVREAPLGDTPAKDLSPEERASLVEIVGEEDDRIARWDRLVSDTQQR